MTEQKLINTMIDAGMQLDKVSVKCADYEIEVDPDSIALKVQGPAAVAAFKKLVFRGLNTWDDADPLVKELGDLITCGEVMQVYRDPVKTPKEPTDASDT